MPTRVITRVARIHGGVHGFMLRIAEHADRARPAKWIALAAALVLALGALVVTDSRRASVLRLGVAYAVVGVVVALAAALAPALLADSVGPADRAAVRAALGVWLDPITAWALAAAVAGVVVALAAAAVVRPIPVMALLRRAWSVVATPPRNRLERVLRAVAVIAVGVAMVAVAARRPRGGDRGGRGAARPRRDGRGAGAGRRAAPSPRHGCAAAAAGRALRVGVVAVLVTPAVAVAALLAGGESPAVARVGRCNGHAALCDRRVDQVAFLGTHNAMAAADEPGWFFAAQDVGISQQLGDGVRALMIDTHYGISTPRGVATRARARELQARQARGRDRRARRGDRRAGEPAHRPQPKGPAAAVPLPHLVRGRRDPCPRRAAGRPSVHGPPSRGGGACCRSRTRPARPTPRR